jgi:3-oxoacyl-[acyl-carrier-protein] synthase-3
MAKSAIISIGAYVPSTILSNDDLSRMMDTNDEWIRTRTGIQQRHIALPEETTASMSFEAADAALRGANMSAEDLDWILLCTDTPEMWTPATACFVQESLKATHASAIDLTGGCAGFLQTLELADALARQQKTVMVIGTELLSRSMDWSDRNTAVLFGDGAGAVIVSPSRNAGIQLTHSRTFSDGSQADILQKPYGGTRNPIPPEIVASGGHHRIHMEGKKVFRQAVYRMANAAHQVLQDTNTSPEDIDWVVPHQANQRILDAVAGELHLPTSKVFSHVRHYANTGSASVILALADMILKGLLEPNQRLVSVAFGDGFSWGSALWDVASLPPAEFLGRDM